MTEGPHPRVVTRRRAVGLAGAAGAGLVLVTFTDTAGATKTAHRTVRVPRRSA